MIGGHIRAITGYIGAAHLQVGQDQVLERHGDDRFAPHPAVREGSDVVLRRHGLADRQRELDEVLLRPLLLQEQELFRGVR